MATKKLIYKGKVTGIRLFPQDGAITITHHNASLGIEVPRDQVERSFRGPEEFLCGLTLGTEIEVAITYGSSSEEGGA